MPMLGQGPYVRLSALLERYFPCQTATDRRRAHALLLDMVEFGEFPPALEVSPRVILFRRDQIAEWEASAGGDVQGVLAKMRDKMRYRRAPRPSVRARRGSDDVDEELQGILTAARRLKAQAAAARRRTRR